MIVNTYLRLLETADFGTRAQLLQAALGDERVPADRHDWLIATVRLMDRRDACREEAANA